MAPPTFEAMKAKTDLDLKRYGRSKLGHVQTNLDAHDFYVLFEGNVDRRRADDPDLKRANPEPSLRKSDLRINFHSRRSCNLDIKDKVFV